MNAIEIRNLKKSFKGLYALNGLNLTVPKGAIYGFIGENGSGKSTTEKLICGHLVKDSGTIKLFGKDFNDEAVRCRVGALIENAGCFPNASVYTNLVMQAINLNIKNKEEEIDRVLKIVRMEGSASNKFKNCSLGMKQRIGIAIALLNEPDILVLDEPINGLDADGVRIIREVLLDITKNKNKTVIISSHILGELEKIATHYGIIRHGKLIKELSAQELEEECKKYIFIKTDNLKDTYNMLNNKYKHIKEENEEIRIYDESDASIILEYLSTKNLLPNEIGKRKITLEEYYIDLMKEVNN